MLCTEPPAAGPTGRPQAVLAALCCATRMQQQQHRRPGPNGAAGSGRAVERACCGRVGPAAPARAAPASALPPSAHRVSGMRRARRRALRPRLPVDGLLSCSRIGRAVPFVRDRMGLCARNRAGRASVRRAALDHCLASPLIRARPACWIGGTISHSAGAACVLHRTLYAFVVSVRLIMRDTSHLEGPHAVGQRAGQGKWLVSMLADTNHKHLIVL
jgi:hypothetical protein